MGTKVNIMDLSVDIIGLDYLILSCKGFLTNDSINIIYLVSAKTLEETTKDNEFKEIIESADFVLPANEMLLSLHHVDALETVGMIVDYKFLYPMFESVSEDMKTVFIIGRSEEEINNLTKFFSKEYPNIKIQGSCEEDLLEKEGFVINEINSIAPDILILAIDTPFQEKWIMENKTKLNSKLCIALGCVTDQILSEHKEPPFLIKELKLEAIYHFIKNNKGIKKIRDVRIFRKNVAHYKNKKSKKKMG